MLHINSTVCKTKSKPPAPTHTYWGGGPNWAIVNQ